MTDIADVHAEAAAAASSFSFPDLVLKSVLGVFWAIGWLWGAWWYLLFFAWAAVKVGYYKGMKITPEMRAQRSAARKAKKQPQSRQ